MCRSRITLRLLRSPRLFGPKPIRGSKENYAAQDKSQIKQREPQQTENQNITCRDQDRRDENDKERAIHGFIWRYAPGRYCARLVSVSHKTTSVTFAPGGMPFS